MLRLAPSMVADGKKVQRNDSKQLNVRVSSDVAAALDKLCKQTGRSYQEIMRPLVEALAGLDPEQFNAAVLQLLGVAASAAQAPAKRHRAG